MLCSSEWEEYFYTDDPLKALNIFNQNSVACIDAVIPLQTLKRFNPKKQCIKPKDRSKLRRLSTSYFSRHDFVTLGSILNTLSSISQAHNLRMRKEECTALTSTTRVCALTDTLKKRMNRKDHNISVLIDKGKLHHNSADICELFNKTFTANYLKPITPLLGTHSISTTILLSSASPKPISTIQFTYANIRQVICYVYILRPCRLRANLT